jgi:hypothetical protein
MGRLGGVAVLLAVAALPRAEALASDGRYGGTGRVTEGPAACGPREPFPVFAQVAGGRFELRLRQGTLAGPVGPGGDLSAIRWVAGGVTETAAGRIEGEAITLSYRFVWANTAGPPCAYHYALRRQG